MPHEIPRSSTTLAGSPPGPRGLPLVGSTFDVQRDALGFYLAATRRYGDIVGYRFIVWPSILINHPDYVQYMLQEHNQNYSKEVFTYHMLSWFMGAGLLTNQGGSWLRQRRLMQPAFHRKRIAAFGDSMAQSSGALLERWRAAASQEMTVDVSQEMMRLTLAIVSRALFALDISDAADDVGQAFAHINHHYANYVATLVLPPRIRTPRNLRFRGARRVLDEFVLALIAKRRRDGIDTGDLLSMLLSVRDEETGEAMTDAQVRDEVMTLLFAGHETAANALCWTWYLLAQHPEVESSLHSELDTVLGGRAPEVDDLARLPCTRMVVDETLRLYPPVWIIPRRAVEDDEIGGYSIPRNTMVHLSPYVLHRHPQFWPDPDRFDPERFTPERSAGRPRFAYCPFGGGPRLCIGNSFALMEIQITIATIAQHVRLRMPPDHTVAPEPQITLTPRPALRMRLQSR